MEQILYPLLQQLRGKLQDNGERRERNQKGQIRNQLEFIGINQRINKDLFFQLALMYFLTKNNKPLVMEK